MGQNIFIPNGGGGGGGSGSSFLTNMVADGGNEYVNYGFDEGGGEAFYSTSDYSFIVAFRVVQENIGADQYPVLRVYDNETPDVGWSIFVSGSDRVCASIDAQIFTPDTSDMPLGRVFFAILTHKGSGGSDYYLNGRYMISNSVVQAPGGSMSIEVGGGGTPTLDFVEYIGFGYIESSLSGSQVCDMYMASLDAGRVVIPAAIVDGAPYVVYNADVGLADPALWVPEFNTLLAPSLPAIPNGIATGTVITAPFHVAHSGWASVPPN
jgi:hypothetical protein